MPTIILVPLDGSELAARALPVAVPIARSTGARVLLVRATADIDDSMVSPAELWRTMQIRERIDRLAQVAEVDEVAKQIGRASVAVATLVRAGPAPDLILEAARTHGADLIVMSTHGRGGLGRWLYGSVADQVLRYSTVPGVLVPAGWEGAWPENRPLRVLLTLDGSSLAVQALEPTMEIVRALQAEVTLLWVVDEAPLSTRVHAPRAGEAQLRDAVTGAHAYLDDVANRLRTDARVVNSCVVVGDPATAIATTARRLGIDLIAMATRGRSGLARLVLGSVATETLRQANVPMLLVRPPNVLSTGKDTSGHAEPVVGLTASPTGVVGPPSHLPVSADHVPPPRRAGE